MDEGPCQASPTRPEISERQEAAVNRRVVANWSHAAAAAIIGPAPGPAYIRAECISGGTVPKSISFVSERLAGSHDYLPFARLAAVTLTVLSGRIHTEYGRLPAAVLHSWTTAVLCAQLV